MAYQYFQNNPSGKVIGDCVVRAVSLATDENWQKTYIGLALQGFLMSDLPNSDSVWGTYLKNNGFVRHTIENSEPDCYTIGDFAADHPNGIYVLGTGSHAVTVIQGTVWDAWDSSNECPIFFYSRD